MRLLVRPCNGGQVQESVARGVPGVGFNGPSVTRTLLCANFFVIWSVKYGWATNYSVTHLEEAGPSDLDRLDPMCPFDRAKDWKRVGVLCCYFAQIVSVFRLKSGRWKKLNAMKENI